MGTLVERAVPAAGGTDEAGTAPPPKPKRPRDPRLDFFRGLCLVMIYINHVPGTIFEHVTSRNFGLSDAAEGFVFMSGCAAALANLEDVFIGADDGTAEAFGRMSMGNSKPSTSGSCQ